MKRLGILLVLLLSTAASANPVYKWTDKNGRVHFGDKPVANSEMIKGKPGTEPAVQTDESQAKAKQAEACQRERDQLNVYQNAARLVEKDALGREREYSAEDKQKLIQMSEQKVKEVCNAKPAAAAAAQ